MPIPNRENPSGTQFDPLPDDSGSSVLRHTAATLGLILIGIGSVMALWMFYQVAQIIVDPRPYSAQIDRWEFVIRGRQLDANPGALEADARRGRQRAQADELDPSEDLSEGIRNVDTAANLAGRVGSKAARPAAVMVTLFLAMILIRIAIGLIDAGAKLTGLAAGERETMKRLLEALKRNRPS